MAAEPATERPALDSERHLARVQELTEALEGLDQGPAKEVAEDLVGAIVDLYGEGLRRVVEALQEGSEVRAAYILQGDQKLVREVEVLQSPAAREKKAD